MTLLNDMHTDWEAKDNDLRAPIVILHTDGSGYWTTEQKPVFVTEFTVPYINDEHSFGELRVHFNTSSWRSDRDGLIYSDMRFLKGLQEHLASLGLAGKDVSYSEHGMQGRNYVSCDAGADFLASWKAKYPQ